MLAKAVEYEKADAWSYQAYPAQYLRISAKACGGLGEQRAYEEQVDISQSAASQRQRTRKWNESQRLIELTLCKPDQGQAIWPGSLLARLSSAALLPPCLDLER